MARGSTQAAVCSRPSWIDFLKDFCGHVSINVMKAHVFQEGIHVINHFAAVLLVCCYLLAVEETIQLREKFTTDVGSV